MSNAPLAITMGEPAGVGPELIAKLWQQRDEVSLPFCFYIGMASALPDVIPVIKIEKPSDALGVFDKALPVMETTSSGSFTLGAPSPSSGKSVIEAIDQAVALCRSGDAGGMVTAPIHKAVLYEAGFSSPGHTEYLASLCCMSSDSSVMMLAVEGLRVVPVTVHMSIKDVPRYLTVDKIVHTASVTAADLRDRFGISHPRLAIAALNPHAGEGGTMGMEEATHITPAIWQLQDMGIDAQGPYPADTLFHEDARATYDAVICMYHDQALIPLKTLDFWGGVNITLGLPIIRTSPDHGTAHTIAGKGIARTDSMLAAIRMADRMAKSNKGTAP
ncbi:4-hydroxythreonine-4-phosphate dehydrogenase 1 [Kordiimonas sediminis]|uniref:4-hydroxythreonine-4-phosphate dehydrogenase n=1 Tax=Kordiimonas sediminis TaxID=1735581 RepID=A0A919AV58_9PROT|nr:4-hydroxythreonine-4-phosphate dehydrogenase PdxA [Kordiimonas sediminis]GHF27637.1 4-hydroxythreonine-4-phosphate dehydrogenase 1 [Kordiimonas sediminis]